MRQGYRYAPCAPGTSPTSDAPCEPGARATDIDGSDISHRLLACPPANPCITPACRPADYELWGAGGLNGCGLPDVLSSAEVGSSIRVTLVLQDYLGAGTATAGGSGSGSSSRLEVRRTLVVVEPCGPGQELCGGACSSVSGAGSGVSGVLGVT